MNGGEGSEVGRVRRVYAAREVGDGRYGWHRPEVHVEHFLRGWRIRRMLDRAAYDLPALRVLDIGCGHGAWLRTLADWGVAPGRLIGGEVIPERARAARVRCPPDTSLALMDGGRLPLADGAVDLVSAFTVLSSVVGDGDRAEILQEVDRVLAPGGALLVYDLRLRNPANPDVRPVTRRELLAGLPGYRATVRTCTLVPPVARRVGRIGALPVLLLEALAPPLRGHALYLLRKPA